MSEWAEWVQILWGFIKFSKFYFKQMLKEFQLSILENKKTLFLKKIFIWAAVSKYARRDQKDGICCPNFQWRFCTYLDVIIILIFFFRLNTTEFLYKKRMMKYLGLNQQLYDLGLSLNDLYNITAAQVILFGKNLSRFLLAADFN